MAYSKRPAKMDYLKEEEFFQAVSAKCNYLDTPLVRNIFYALVKVIVYELKKKGVARLPDFGDFVITVHKERNIANVRTGIIERLPAKKTIKFLTDYKLRKYLNM